MKNLKYDTANIRQNTDTFPVAEQGMYSPAFEHDACGMGFVANVKGIKSRLIIDKGLEASP